MRILFDSQNSLYKKPFGCVAQGETCNLNIHIPESVGTTAVCCVLQHQDGSLCKEVPLTFRQQRGAYQVFGGDFTLTPGLYFYYFRITGCTGTFRLFKQENDTNMEAGDLWQLTCTPADFVTPDWAKGAVIYQIFPDRFHKSGECDLTGKLQPYEVHENWDEEIVWEPTPEGEVLNNDFFGRNFRGITEKMDYIASLGVTILYLNPISKSFSSHRYDTGDYKTPDPMLGTEEDFAAMCDAAHSYGIKVIWHVVYSHICSDSLYFNKKGSFGKGGAYNSPDSPYYSWYQFKHYPDKYVSWWDFDTLPTVNKMDPAFVEYVITGRDSVIAHWLNLGADGFRLDVVDELPNEFVDIMKKHLRKLRPDALLMGEVWEDASNKLAYGVRRRYFVDATLDSVMNYPYQKAIIAFLRGYDDGRNFRNAVMTILENYPRQVVNCNMNMLGTHDTARILTKLVEDPSDDRATQAQRQFTPEQLALAKERLRLATVLQFALPGCPSIYYGDEAGMEGGKDPFNRRTYPWGKEDKALLAHFRALGNLRKEKDALRLGDLEFICAEEGRIGFKRTWEGKTVRIYVNQNDTPWEVPGGKLLLGHNLRNVAPEWVSLLNMGWCIVED